MAVRNLFGFNIEGLDAPTLIDGSHLLWLLALAVAMAASARRGLSPRGILALGVLGHALAWFVTMFPLANPYGANGSADREHHLGWASIVAATGDFRASSQVHHPPIEPVWPNLVALAAGYNPQNVQLVFQVAPLVMGWLVIATFYWAFARSQPDEDGRRSAALCAVFTVLLSSTFLDYTSAFKTPWALAFLLKPNHTLGLALFPLALWATAAARSWRARIGAGLLLQLVGWAFVVHMMFVVWGLLVFVAISFWRKDADRRESLVNAVAVVAVNLLIVSPYLLKLTRVASRLQSDPRFAIPAGSSHTFDVTLRLGLVFALACWGALGAIRSEHRFVRMMSAQFLAAHVAWQLVRIPSAFQAAPELDELHHWLRFLTGGMAGIGMWRLVSEWGYRLKEWRPGGSFAHAMALVPLLSAVPMWWDPGVMDVYFNAARRPLSLNVSDATAFFRASTDARDVVVSDPAMSRLIAAYGWRRCLFSRGMDGVWDQERRARAEAAIVTGGPHADRTDAFEYYGIRWLVATRALLDRHRGLSFDALRDRPDLSLRLAGGQGAEHFEIFAVVPPS